MGESEAMVSVGAALSGMPEHPSNAQRPAAKDSRAIIDLILGLTLTKHATATACPLLILQTS